MDAAQIFASAEGKKRAREMKAIALPGCSGERGPGRGRCWSLEVCGPAGLAFGALAPHTFGEQLGAGLVGPRVSGLEKMT